MNRTTIITLAFLLVGANPPVGCFGNGPDPDTDGGNGAFSATISMSLPNGLTVADFKVDGAVVCSGVATCEHKVSEAKSYEVTATVTNGLCPTSPADITDDGDLELVELPCGLAPGYPEPQVYTDPSNQEIDFSTQVQDGKVIMHGFLQDVDAEVNGNTFIMDRTASSGVREVFEGTISSDLCQIIYHVTRYDASGNITLENDHTLTSTDC